MFTNHSHNLAKFTKTFISLSLLALIIRTLSIIIFAFFFKDQIYLKFSGWVPVVGYTATTENFQKINTYSLYFTQLYLLVNTAIMVTKKIDNLYNVFSQFCIQILLGFSLILNLFLDRVSIQTTQSLVYMEISIVIISFLLIFTKVHSPLNRLKA